ncbi:cyclophilin-like domain-containing protein [Microdochium trichocladiopsis]|uniref:peptidylprolyl isomerase n=1 Tax=Microdochium trichocladiopsis TaxID=1682393 RepID=A0A9P8XWE2_9PEZI|nr:cyclophilin-like domain-containing protein [Microdochium trichocladiopsis]KAH7021172.1 cyclophilin-like domain-containing protein [Microdochium trichocladiopsis]
MSSIYNLEPQPTASVILKTTLGDLSVELFAKQTPLTSRNFLQLCLDGYYNDTIFHRLVPGFIIQGGDPTGTGNGGECIYDGGAYSGDLDPWPMDQRRGANAGTEGIGFRDEFHSRLKFNRRGLLGMANEGKPDTNGSQFFFTLEKAEELNNRNTVFGRIVGDTIYNLARMGEAEVAEGTERPLYPIKITGVEILVNPFEDMKQSDRAVRNAETTTRTQPAQQQQKKGKKAKAAGKKLLSFGDDEADGEEMPVFKKTKFDSRVVAPPTADEQEKGEPRASKPKKKQTSSSRDAESKELERTRSPQRPSAGADEQRTTVKRAATESRPKPSRPTYDEEESISPEPEEKKKSALDTVNEEIAALKASMKRGTHTDTIKETKKTPLEKMIPETSTRGRKRRRGGEGTMTDADLAMFEAFRSRLGQAHVSAGDGGSSTANSAHPGTEGTSERNEDGTNGKDRAGVDDEEAELCDLHFIANCQSCKSWDKEGAGASDDDDDNDPGWMSHRLTFAADKLGKDLTYRKKAEEELVVIDPREKARTLKEEKRAKRSAQSGESSREWDQARNAKLARQSALAGRGAR